MQSHIASFIGSKLVRRFLIFIRLVRLAISSSSFRETEIKSEYGEFDLIGNIFDVCLCISDIFYIFIFSSFGLPTRRRVHFERKKKKREIESS